MTINFNSKLFLSYLVSFLIMVFIAKLIGLGLLLFLPKEGIQSSLKSEFVMPYMRYSIDGFRLKASDVKTVDGADSLSIDSIVLKAIYLMGEESIIVVAPKAKKEKSKTVSIGETFEGYKLKKVYSEYVIFERDYKTYRLYISKPKETSRWKSVRKGPVEEPVRRISSKEVRKAMANPTEIWKNIGLKQHFSSGIADGFQVSFVRKGTAFEALGLRVGDVIQSINNKELKNNAQAFNAYQELKSTNALKLTILRANIPMELEYEIF